MKRLSYCLVRRRSCRWYVLLAQAILEYEKEHASKAEKSIWKTLKAFVGKNFQTIIIVALLFYALGGAKLFENMIGKMFSEHVTAEKV
ncbi:MAG: hypothetical protein LBF88_13885, partial [Planctomycetaceae bacterium]|nr:hypothetical protein [Planctomycetaceae bacterium]